MMPMVPVHDVEDAIAGPKRALVVEESVVQEVQRIVDLHLRIERIHVVEFPSGPADGVASLAPVLPLADSRVCRVSVL